MMRLRRGRDGYGVVHYDSKIKQQYIYPVCRTPYLGLTLVTQSQVVTCMRCVGDLPEFETHWGEPAC